MKFRIFFAVLFAIIFAGGLLARFYHPHSDSSPATSQQVTFPQNSPKQEGLGSVPYLFIDGEFEGQSMLIDDDGDDKTKVLNQQALVFPTELQGDACVVVGHGIREVEEKFAGGKSRKVLFAEILYGFLNDPTHVTFVQHNVKLINYSEEQAEVALEELYPLNKPSSCLDEAAHAWNRLDESTKTLIRLEKEEELKSQK